VGAGAYNRDIPVNISIDFSSSTMASRMIEKGAVAALEASPGMRNKPVDNSSMEAQERSDCHSLTTCSTPMNALSVKDDYATESQPEQEDSVFANDESVENKSEYSSERDGYRMRVPAPMTTRDTNYSASAMPPLHPRRYRKLPPVGEEACSHDADSRASEYSYAQDEEATFQASEPNSNTSKERNDDETVNTIHETIQEIVQEAQKYQVVRSGMGIFQEVRKHQILKIVKEGGQELIEGLQGKNNQYRERREDREYTYDDIANDDMSSRGDNNEDYAVTNYDHDQQHPTQDGHPIINEAVTGIKQELHKYKLVRDGIDMAQNVNKKGFNMVKQNLSVIKDTIRTTDCTTGCANLQTSRSVSSFKRMGSESESTIKRMRGVRGVGDESMSYDESSFDTDNEGSEAGFESIGSHPKNDVCYECNPFWIFDRNGVNENVPRRIHLRR